MLARLQQALTLGALALALVWATVNWRAGRPGWALVGAALVIGGYALVLGLEFLLLRSAHGSDPTPRARPGQLLRAWWGEALSAPLVFCWRQPFRSDLWPDHLPADAAGRRGLLLVHGFVCNRGIWNRWLQRLTARGTPFVAVNLEPVFGAIDDTLEIVDAAVQRLERATGLPPVIVAHSMGGLVTRRWLAERGDPQRVAHVVTLGTPHHGTWLARFATVRNARQMQLGSAWLRTLEQREPAGLGALFTCFYSHCDNIVFPPRTATLIGADNRHLEAVAHVHMVERGEPWEEVIARLEAPQPPPRAAA
jgi:triacylglycerol lipase